MARKLSFYVSTSTNTVTVIDQESATLVPYGGGVTGFGQWGLTPVNTTDLTDLGAQITMRSVLGHQIGQFAFADIDVMNIDGTPQTSANLGEWMLAFAPYLFQDDLSATIASVLASNGVIINTSNTIVGSGDGEKLNALGATAITVQFSITGTTALATNTVKLYATIDQTTWYQIGSTYSGVGDVTGLLLNYTLISDTTIPLQVRVVVVDGGAGTMTTQAVILGIRG